MESTRVSSIIPCFASSWVEKNWSASQVFREIGNTSLAWFFGHKAICCTGGEYNEEHEIKVVIEEVKAAGMERWHHPEPNFADKWDIDVTNKCLQIRGVWTKTITKSGTKPKGRHSFAGSIWEGGMYVGGGEHDVKCLNDFW